MSSWGQGCVLVCGAHRFMFLNGNYETKRFRSFYGDMQK